VTFDAWRYDGETLRRHLLRDVAKGLKDDKALPRWFRVARRLEELDVDRQQTSFRVRPSVGGLAIALFQALVVAAGILVAFQLSPVKESLDAQDPKRGVLLSLVLGLITFAGTLAGQVMRPSPMARTRRRTEDPERFHEIFRDLVRAVRRDRVVVAVDNLDRCAPEVALELLSTIKTYLEPAADQARNGGAAWWRWPRVPDTEVMFVLAIDEEALLRHASGGKKADADGSAREFLRKIFTATITVVPLLNEDVRRFALDKLVVLRKGLGLSREEEHQLATLLDASLRRTPRQVLQFLNNLQLRIALIKAREGGVAPALAEPISDRPLMVAKLALICERWPDRYRKLLAAPQLLDEWHSAVRMPDPNGDFEPDFAAFLRISDTIRAPNLRPFLSVGQAEEERGLVRFGEFRTAVTSGADATIAEILEHAGDDAAGYLARLAAIFAEESQAGSIAAARSVVAVALIEPRLGPANTMAVGLVRNVLDDPRFGSEQDALPAGPFLEAAIQTDAARCEQAIESVIRRLASGVPERALDAARAIARHKGEIAPAGHAELRRQTANRPLLDDLAALDVLARADPRWLSATTAGLILTRLGEEPQLLSGGSGDAVVGLVRTVVRTSDLAGMVGRLVQSLAATADRTVGDVRALARAVTIAGLLKRRAEDLERLMKAWVDAVESLPVESAAAAARMLWPLVENDPASPSSEPIVLVLARDAHGTGFLRNKVPGMDARARFATGRALAAAFVREPGLWEQPGPITLLREIEGDRFQGTGLDVALQWTFAGVPIEQIRELVTEVGIDIAAARTHQELAARVAASGVDPGIALPWGEAAVAASPVPADVARTIAGVLQDAFPPLLPLYAPAVERALSVASRLGTETSRAGTRIGDDIIPRLKELGDAQVILLIIVLAQHGGLLARHQRIAVWRMGLERWLGAPGDPGLWRSSLVDLGGFVGGSGDEHDDVSTLLLDEERRLGDTGKRAEVLVLAAEILGDASPALARRLEQLELSDEADDRRVLALTRGGARG
jgi:hypothetical protein